MSGRKLKKMLRKTPGIAKFYIGLFCFVFCFWPIVMIKQYQSGDTSSLPIAAITGLFVFVFGFFYCKALISYIKTAKENGRRTIDYLERNNLLELAADEYFGVEKTECRITHSFGKYNKISLHRNAVTKSFIFAMTENVIIPYCDAASASIISGVYRNNGHRGVRYTQDILTIKTIDGRSIELHAIEHKRYTEKQNDIIEKVFSAIERNNPNCKIDRTVIG